jgi:hypothetical protein
MKREKKIVDKQKKSKKYFCYHCDKELSFSERVFFVEKEVGRLFCSELCIVDYFEPEVKQLEKEYDRKLGEQYLSEEFLEEEFKWMTLQNPQEIWRKKTTLGDYRFTFMASYVIDHQKMWCVCLCLCLQEKPSFLYFAFFTRHEKMVEAYRKGECLSTREIDGLASPWTQEEFQKAEKICTTLSQGYTQFLEQTLDAPDEVWSLLSQKHDAESLRVYHFIRSYPKQTGQFIWYVVVAQETQDPHQIEILDAFPTQDAELLQAYRVGKEELGLSGTLRMTCVH